MQKWFILCLFAIAILCRVHSAQGFENELAIYRNPALSPDESQVAFECRDWDTGAQEEMPKGESDIFLADIKGSNLRQLTFMSGDFHLSPDNTKVLINSGYGLYLLDLNKKEAPRQVFNRFPEVYLSREWSPIRQLSWSPSGKKFFFARTIGDVISGQKKNSIVDAETLGETVLDDELGSIPSRIQWIDDNTIIYERDNEILIYNYLTKKGDLLASGYPNEPCTDPVLSPDMQKMLYRYTDQYKVRLGPQMKIVICEIKDLPDWAAEELAKKLWSGEEKMFKKTDYLLLGGSISQVKVSWFRDSQRLLIKGLKELWIYNLTDSSYTPVFLDSIPIKEALLTPDQNKVFFISSLWSSEHEDARITGKGNSSNLKVYDLKNKVCRTIFRDSGPISQLRLSSDGSSLALVRGGNIWIVNTATEKGYQLTSDGGLSPQWLLNDKSILFSSDGSLVKADLRTGKFTNLTLGRGTEPTWISDKEVVVKSRGKFWQVSVDKIRVKEIQKYPDKPRLTKGKKYEVYIDEVKLVPRSPDLTQVKAQDLKTSQSWVVKRPWCNFPWALEEKNR
ncbi:MAG: DPP IV N-terminal domain-containing protein [candidate division Zixibacteria bacterium]|nr:DPP IV N-terminal domain-containing protein [candidate division Zixibacteria bacterium]